MSDSEDPIGLPEVVQFETSGSGRRKGRAFVVFGNHYGMTYQGMTLNFPEKPDVRIEYVPTGSRVVINEGLLWFDTDERSAAAIEYLYENGTAPDPGSPKQ